MPNMPKKKGIRKDSSSKSSPSRSSSGGRKHGLRQRESGAGHLKPHEQIIKLLKSSNTPLSFDEVLKKLHVNSRGRSYYLYKLTEMSNRGLIEKTVDDKFTVAKPKIVSATIISLSQHFSFARPTEGDEIYIHHSDLNGALPGDKVNIIVSSNDKRGPRGKISKINQEGNRLYSGKVEKTDDGLFVSPDSQIRFSIQIAKKQHYDAGTKVRFSLKEDRFGEYFADVKTIYGDSNSAKVCSDAIIDNAGITTIFSDEVLQNAKKLNETAISESEIQKRTDLRATEVITIDGADAKDFDDAISVLKTEKGWELGVHIADVAHFVSRDSLIDTEARNRGTSVYFSDRVIPMLPEALSNGICSLTAGTDKLTMSVFITFDNSGEIVDFNICKSVIKSSLRGVYTDINKMIDGTANAEIMSKYSSFMPMIVELKNLADVLKKKANQRGTMELESSESYFILDENGHPIDIRPRVTGESEHMIEQFMISANVAVAMFARKKKIPLIYRVHDKPNGDKLLLLSKLATSLNFKNVKLEHHSDIQKMLDESKNTQFSKLISNRMLRSMAKAEYSSDPIGHFGLALKDYAHFTAPIRRYSDLTVHQILSSLLNGDKTEKVVQKYTSVASESAAIASSCEVRAVSAERNCEDCYKAEYMLQYLGQEFDGVIDSVTKFGMFIELENSVDGLVPLENLPYDDLKFDDMASYVDKLGKVIYRVGDSIKIKVVSADVSAGLIEFALA